jgi:hypothetical protein
MLTDPRLLKPSLGREGWCQRLLTELILDGQYPPYNTRRTPSSLGQRFLAELDSVCFGSDGISGRDVVFVDEIDFPARHADGKGCAPDYTVFVDDRCWIIELKTEPGSQGPRQVPDYFERAHHYHPDFGIDLTYLTAGLRSPFTPEVPPGARYFHIEWHGVAELIRSTWARVEDDHKFVVRLLLEGIGHLADPPIEWWARLGYGSAVPAAEVEIAAASVEPVAVAAADPLHAATHEGLVLAAASADDGMQRAIGLETGGLDALHELRLRLRRELRGGESSLSVVQPWLWSQQTSGGKAMTDAGLRTGYELRLSRSRS